ncbi:MAG: MBL fold metallo-hydrolase, partial [Pseudomonadota bacterium]
MIPCNAILKTIATVIVSMFFLVACDRSAPLPPAEGSDATSYTIAVNNEFAKNLNLDDQEGFEDASRGLIAEAPAVPIKDNDGKVIWDATDYDFVQGDPPDTVNPSLWRQSKLNLKRGLFEVDEGIYQLRGFDLANITIIEGDSGWIVVDPLTTEATTREAMAFAREHLGDKPISAILFTHSHIDHFGGVFGLMT